MNFVRKTLLSFAVFMIASAPQALAQGTYTQIDVPGAIGTAIYGINTSGDLAGWYEDVNFHLHGLLIRNGSIITIDYPGELDTAFFGINDVGQLVGFAETPLKPTSIGFSYDIPSQTFTPISFPNSTYTFPMAINNGGTVAGYFSSPSQNGQFGFALIGSQYRRVRPTGSPYSAVTGVTDSGKLLGFVYSHGGSYINFVFKEGEFDEVNIPNDPVAAIVNGVNPSGTELVGVYLPRSPTVAGFLLKGKILQKLQFPGANATYAYGVNAMGDAVGAFVDPSGVQHGFIWTPPEDASAK